MYVKPNLEIRPDRNTIYPAGKPVEMPLQLAQRLLAVGLVELIEKKEPKKSKRK